MTRHEMAAELVAQAERFLQVDGARAVEAGGDAQRFARYVEAEPAFRLLHHGQAAALHANRIADAHAGERRAAGGDLQRFQLLDAADGLDDAGEH